MSFLPEQTETEKRFTKVRAIFSWMVLRFVIAAIILTAAGMKAHQLATTPSLGEGLLDARWFNILVVEFELLFGIWLIFGLLPKLTWLATVGCFSVFAAVSFYKAVSGEASCGCFGAATINPLITTVFDSFVIGALFFSHPPGMLFSLRGVISELLRTPQKRKVVWMSLIWLVIAVPTTMAMMSVEKNDIMELGTEFIGADGRKTILLEPEKWIGKEFPVISRIAESVGREKLKEGDWTIIFVHADCSKCLQLLRGLESNCSQKIAVVIVPTHSNDDMPRTAIPIYRLDNKNDWFVTTPYSVRLSNGICIEIGENDDGT